MTPITIYKEDLQSLWEVVKSDKQDTDEEINLEKIDPRLLSELEQMSKDFKGVSRHLAISTAHKLLEMGVNFDPSIVRELLIRRFSWQHGDATLARHSRMFTNVVIVAKLNLIINFHTIFDHGITDCTAID